MAYDDRYGNEDRNRAGWRGQSGGRPDRNREGEDRGFFERAGEAMGSWFGGDHDRDERHSYGRPGEHDYDRGYGRDQSDRSPGSHTDYYRGGDRGQRRAGPEGGFEFREDYRRDDRYSEQGQARPRGGGRDDDHRYAGGSSGGRSGGGSGGMAGGGASYGSVGVGSGSDRDSHSIGGLGAAPEFSDGPRFDRQDVGTVGSHGVHPVSSAFGDAQRDPMGADAIGGGAGGSSARARAILQQAEQHGGRGRIEPGEQAPAPRQGGYGQAGTYGQPQGSQRHQYGHSGEYGQAGGQQRSRFEHDPHYHEWRSRHLQSLDSDYEEYRRENASRFESEFSSWREKRGQQRQSLGRARPQMEVVGSDGQHVGTVDKVAGERIILTKSDPNAGGHHHSIPCSWIENVDEKVTISKTAEQAMAAWRDEETSRALNEDQNSGSDGPHVLERSFSGTYSDKDG